MFWLKRRHERGDQQGHAGGEHRRHRLQGLLETRMGFRPLHQRADQQAVDARHADVQPRQSQHAGDGGGGQAVSQHLHRAEAARRRSVERAHLRVRLGQSEPPGHHVLGDAVGLGKSIQVGLARWQADDARGVALAGRALRIGEGQDQSGRVGPGLALQAQLLGHGADRPFEALRRGAVSVQAFGQLDHEIDACGVTGGAQRRRIRHRRSMARGGDARQPCAAESATAFAPFSHGSGYAGCYPPARSPDPYPMTPQTAHLPQIAADDQAPSRLRLSGAWTLDHASQIGQALGGAPDDIAAIDATGVERLDSVGVLQLLRFARRHGIDFERVHLPRIAPAHWSARSRTSPTTARAGSASTASAPRWNAWAARCTTTGRKRWRWSVSSARRR